MSINRSNFLRWAMASACLGVISCSSIQTSPKMQESPVAVPAATTKTTIQYLAVGGGDPVPKEPVIVADEKTMRAIVAAAKSNNRTLYDKLALSKSASLIPGGATVTVIQEKSGLVEVQLHSRDIKEVDLSGQTRWTDPRFIQEMRI